MDFNKMPISDYSTPLLRRGEDKKTCPKCSSVFVTDTECEGCGYQLSFDALGEPFGEKSFFNLRDEYLHQHNLHYLLVGLGLVKKNKEQKKYERKALKRLEVLCQYFFTQQEKDREKRRLFLFEAQEVLKELVKFKIPKSYLWIILEKGEDHPFFETLSKELKVEELERDGVLKYLLTNIPTPIRNFPSWGIFLQLGVGAGSIVIAAFLVMRYLTAVN